MRNVVLFTGLLIPTVAASQEIDPGVVTLDRVFTSQEFVGDTFGPARWLEDGSAYTTVEPSATIEKGADIVRYDTGSGERSVLISASELIPAGRDDPLEIHDYDWSPDGGRVLIYTNSQRVWRDNTRGDYWVLERTSGRLRQLGGEAPPATLMFAKFSPDGSRVGYVRENNVYVENVADGSIVQLTRDGSRTIINGTFDWVYEEELGLQDGWRWSPDGERIAYWQLDAEGVRDFLLLNTTDSLYSFTIPIQYPKAGETNSAARVGVVSSSGGETTWLSVPGDPRNNYIARLEWAASSEEVLIRHLNRLQNTLQVMLGDVETGAVRTILTETEPEAWVDLRVEALEWLDDGSEFVWVSERDEWRRIYVVSRDGTSVRPVSGPFDITALDRIDAEDGWVYYIASPEDPLRRYLYRSRLDGSGVHERLTPVDAAGSHEYDVSPSADWAFHTFHAFGVPPTIDLVHLPDHRIVRNLMVNERLRNRVEAIERGPVEFFRVDVGDGLEIDGWIMKPPDFEPNKTYPILFYVYGEPAGQTVEDEWGGNRYLWHLMLTQQGYLVASVDPRGTPVPRGTHWRKVIYRQIGTLTSRDIAEAARKVLDRPYVDETRVGIWGWSGGGSQSLNSIFRYPDVFGTALAVAPVPDIRLYDTIYQERYMGLPQTNPEDYERSSPLTHAEGLEGNLLVVHGTGDDNVHYQGTERLVNALVKANKPFTMMAYPNRTHRIAEGENTSRHLYELLTRYLNENVEPGGRPGPKERPTT